MMISRLSSGRVRSTHCQILAGADAPVTPIITRSLQICLPMSPDPPAGQRTELGNTAFDWVKMVRTGLCSF